MSTTTSSRPRVAIVGSGIAGLGAALGLQDVCDVVLYEAGERLGGHILPVGVPGPDGEAAAVDTGFVVFVPQTYPHVTRLLESLGVGHEAAVTRFRITDDLRDLSFEPGELLGLCGKRIPRECRRDLLGLHRTLQRIRKEGLDWIDDVSMDDWLAEQGFAAETIELGVLPWVASFWGLQPEAVRTVAASVALREIARNAGPYQMHRVVPSTQIYLDRMLEAVARTEIRRQRVQRVTLEGGPVVETSEGSESFDRVVLAVMAEDARALLADASPRVGEVLGQVSYESTVAVLHRDTSLLPEDRADWRTFHHRRRRDPDRVRSVTTWVLDLLHRWHDDPAEIGEPTLLSTGDPGLLDEGIIEPARILEGFRHRHLVMTPSMLGALAELPQLDRDQAFTLAGSYVSLGGLHEDALNSGVRAAHKVREELGLSAPTWPWSNDG